MTEVMVSPLPVFDFEKALLAKEETGKGVYIDIPNVRTTGNLWLYNTPPERWPAVMRKLDWLRQVEQSISGSDNLLPTIGWEVEIPRKPFQTSRAGMYALFFDFMGLPRNKNHTNITPGNPGPYQVTPFFWEFSTAPAYSAAVANRTLCELIKGGFIPHLDGPSTALDRRNLLDNKLVSLHINLGIPPWLFNVPREGTIESQEDIVLLASSFEFAYTSSERFTHRSQTSVVVSKPAEQTAKNTDPQAYRLELKAFEVGSANTYRLMEEIQLVAATAFSAMADRDITLTVIWQKTKVRIQAAYEKYYLEPKMIVDRTAADKVRDRDVQRDLRQILTDAAHQVEPIKIPMSVGGGWSDLLRTQIASFQPLFAIPDYSDKYGGYGQNER